MKTFESEARAVIFELLRIALIRARNIVAGGWVFPRRKAALAQWTELVHTLPALLIGGCGVDGVRYFLDTGGAMFKRKYPYASDCDFEAACGLLDELAVLVDRAGPRPW